ncbi:MAG: toll/interleukin-1 receptor domain-containing protein [Anaerolineae bacterium]|nr:toll/interleukin-1 receptor domain-containing protein [Anaerolineae bacterium]
MQRQTIFISYSRIDSTFAESVAQVLREANFSIWKDTENLDPGTSSWEHAIRDAIQASAAVILIASPNALQSAFVQGELTLARLLNRPIYPIWVLGNNWIESAPLYMANCQYIDGRKEHFAKAIEQLKSTLKKVIDTSQGSITIGLPTHENIEVNLAEFSDTRHLIDALFIHFGVDYWFDIWTYGKEWVLANVETHQLLLPFFWLALDHSVGVSQVKHSWANKRLEAFNVKPGDYWAVWHLSRLSVAGFAINSRNIFDNLTSKYAIRDIELLELEGKIVSRELDYLQLTKHFRYHFLIGLIGDQMYGLSKRKEKEYQLYTEASQS